ncbi:MAG TPA: hypothetical protein VJB66_05280 [Candidatus Nanoarchaeia archaeon]|nr:hypothetical protein [Candidatus Nanoarchaeia archaeon]
MSLTRETLVSFRVHYWSDSIQRVPVADILSDLEQQFPDGFKAAEATAYWKNKYRGSPYFDSKSSGEFYSKLCDARFLHRRELAGKGKKHYRYFVGSGEPDTQSQYVERNILFPEGLLKLLEFSGTLTDQALPDMLVATLERLILEDPQLSARLTRIKTEDPSYYAQIGGAYFDKLLGKQKQE